MKRALIAQHRTLSVPVNCTTCMYNVDFEESWSGAKYQQCLKNKLARCLEGNFSDWKYNGAGEVIEISEEEHEVE